ADKAPESFSLLEVAGTTGGFRLPQLTTVQRNKLSVSGKDLAEGLTIYNTTTKCTDTWNGTAWISNCGSNVAPQITTQPRAFNWAETKNATALTGIAGESATISVSATGIGTLTYQWYEVAANTNAAPALIAGETAATFTPDLSALGMRRYYCQVTDANGNSINSDIAEVAVGCGAKTVSGGWSKFMCYNLGATDQSIEAQKAYSSPVYSFSGTTADVTQRNSDVYGDLYQWGRTRDGHEKRTSDVSDVVVTDVTTGGTTTNGVTTGGINTFIKVSTYPYNWTSALTADLNWRNQKNSTYDPCPSGFRVPAQGEWSDIFRGGSAPGAKATAVANTWTWHDAASGTAGYEIKPDGVTTTLFLPAAGSRYNGDAELYSVGSTGLYWSGSLSSVYSLYLHFTGSYVFPATLSNRALGFSVRCIAEL
ncbi:hypothetical protein D0T49_12505, partial [Paludibacter sp. 221]|uniref:fibrobacter succinogenes major paralogous domain-containing protein n=1 Tax=Paludibacter sp. 221 TaxID=2302939 RepID=UPI001DB1294F